MANDIKTWVELNRELLVQARALINATAEPSNIWRGARLAEQLAGVDDDVKVGGRATKAQVMAVAGMWGSFKQWIGTPMTGFAALFAMLPAMQRYTAARAAYEAIADGDNQAGIDNALAAMDAAATELLDSTVQTIATFEQGGDAPFNVIFGELD